MYNGKEKKFKGQDTTVVEEVLNYTDRWNQPITSLIQNIGAM